MPNLFELLANDKDFQESKASIKDFLSGVAKGATVDVVGGAGDLVNLGRGAVGSSPLPIGTDVLRGKLGLQASSEDSAEEKIGNIASMAINPATLVKGIAIPAAAAAGAMFVGSKTAGPVSKLASILPDQMGAIVGHASPFKFDAFEKGKLRTGEGSNIIAPGIYLSEHPGTNLFYQDLVKKIVKEDTNPTIRMHKFNVESQKATAKYTPDIFDGIAYAEAQLKKAVEKHRSTKFDPTNYEVDLPDESIKKMLDWDKPLNLLSKEDQASIQRIAKQEGLLPSGKTSNLAEDLTGKEFYEALERKVGNKERAADILGSYGITGVKYLDRLSRDKGGTVNYVVFDPSILKILRSESIK